MYYITVCILLYWFCAFYSLTTIYFVMLFAFPKLIQFKKICYLKQIILAD